MELTTTAANARVFSTSAHAPIDCCCFTAGRWNLVGKQQVSAVSMTIGQAEHTRNDDGTYRLHSFQASERISVTLLMNASKGASEHAGANRARYPNCVTICAKSPSMPFHWAFLASLSW